MPKNRIGVASMMALAVGDALSIDAARDERQRAANR
jgi:hypothetical protein